MLACSLIVSLAASAAVAAPTAEARALGDTVLAAIASPDADLRAIAIDRVRYGLKGDWFTRVVGERLPSLPPAVQAAVLSALGDRGDAAALPAAASLLDSSSDAGSRAAALLAIGKLGGAADVARIVKSLAANDPERAAARRALLVLGGSDSPAAIRAAAQAATGVTRAALIEVLASRRDRAALADMVAATSDADAGIRQAGVGGVAALGGPGEVEGLARGLLKAEPGGNRDEIEKAIVAICTVNTGREQATEKFLGVFKAAGEADRETLLPALGRIGGPAALGIVDGMINDPVSRKQGLAALTRWPDAAVKDRLLALLASSTDEGEKKLLLASLIRIAPLPNNKLNDGQKLELLKKTMDLCDRPEDKAKVLERANAIRTIETFRFVVPYLDDPALAEPACRSVVELAHHQKLRDAHKDEFVKALDKVLGTTKNEELVDRANRYKAGQTWDRNKKG
ncbi:MAG: HEAT repeat domain-containing protein [Planctomycetia bacterium]|nr:HEAT repeat domain-containing protein [Planctomycetia bacterium]